MEIRKNMRGNHTEEVFKTGSMSRTDRMAKNDQPIRIEEQSGDMIEYGYKSLEQTRI